jgi:membrane-bound lytic murein transglycosylase B
VGFRRNEVPIPYSPGAILLGALLLAGILLLPCSTLANWAPLIDRLVADGFDESAIRTLFSRPEVRFESGAMSSKLKELLKTNHNKQQTPPSYNPRAVYRGYLKEKLITRARCYLEENMELLENLSSEYCVPKEIVVSILLVETRLGDSVGGRWAFNSLASMALCTDLETIRPYLPKKLIGPKNQDLARVLCREKADWAYVELKALILYAFGSGFDPLSLPGSIYGAIGLCQFMPTNVLSYGVDADNDGCINLFAQADALSSIANYLRGHGWECAMDRTRQHRVILDYNRSSIYANTVLTVAEKLRGKPGPKR